MFVIDSLFDHTIFFKLRHRRILPTRIPITFLPVLTASFLHITYLLLQSTSHSWTTFTDTKPPYAAAVLPPFVLSITGTPEVAFTIQKLD
jgi:hypothetical protein